MPDENEQFDEDDNSSEERHQEEKLLYPKDLEEEMDGLDLKKPEEDDEQMEGGEDQPERKVIRVYFRNMRQLNKKFKLEDHNLRHLNFVALDLELSFVKIENMSEEDAHLL